ncbi:caspase family protein [Sphingobacterium sp.]|uniref:caspase family protein n=1 Tax=Sphingobacterium sp. TaxID=341027 RepID=UPI0031D77554
MKLERRYAIVIGINDYEISPLDYCVNDAVSIAEILKTNCLFEVDDVFLITSSKDHPTKDITGHFEHALKIITEQLKTGEESVFFYFAGHGKYAMDKSVLAFHDSEIEIKDIFDKINLLQPKFQSYFIDACESGGKVLTRRGQEQGDLTRYLHASSGTLLMYAATEKQFATEDSEIEHGLFTNYFLKAIANESLYDEGILTPNRIQDYVSKETQKGSNFEQTPVIETRSIGYYPFAMTLEKVEKERSQKKLPLPLTSTTDKDEEFEYFPEVPNEIRVNIFNQIRTESTLSMESIKSQLSIEGYQVSINKNFREFPSNIDDQLTELIVNESVKQKVIALPGIFSSIREEIKPNLLSSFSMISALLKEEKKYRYYNTINFESANLITNVYLLNSDSIYKVSAGLIQLVYQSLYGIGMIDCSYFLDYNGYKNNELKGPYIRTYAFKFNSQTVDNVKGTLLKGAESFKRDVENWNEKRARDIEEFNQKSM